MKKLLSSCCRRLEARKIFVLILIAQFHSNQIFVNGAEGNSTDDSEVDVIPILDQTIDDAPNDANVYNVFIGGKAATQKPLNIDHALLCADGTPQMEGTEPKACSPMVPDSCAPDHWCHMGDSNQTAYCCPRNHNGQSPCHLHPVIGYGAAKLERFWFDWTENTCKNFTYTGYGGNENNFFTMADCLSHCEGQATFTTEAPRQRPLANDWEMPEGVTRPTNPRPAIEMDAAVDAFPAIEIVMSGDSPSSKLSGNERGPDPCVMAVDQGALVENAQPTERWYWNSKEQKCKQFQYMGSGGNQNHFLTRLQCVDTCGAGPSDRKSCSEPMSVGDGFYQIPRWSYDPDFEQCRLFMYTGYAGSNNRFINEFDCQMLCLTEPSIDSDSESTRSPNAIAKQQPNQVISPCRTTTTQPTTYCGTGATCPGQTYCQQGTTQQTTVCCPSAGTNSCTQPLTPGTGSQSVVRWYFNSATGRCETFVYRGVQGNQNNYQTYDQCTQSCGANPCGAGAPYQQNGQSLQCSAIQQTLCPSNYYCHIGPDSSNSVCCPVQGSPCELPTARGNGQATLQRWSFNTNTKQCQPFIYSGVGGNQNNFLTQADCISMCRVSINPCSVGQPIAINGVSQACSTVNLNVCAQNSYCHLGANVETTVCCPKTGTNPCQLSLATGTGNTVLPRWYFDAANSQCKAFTYTGLAGNENNFLSLADCRRTCPEYDNPCPAGNPPINAATGQVSYCSNSNTICPSNYWCHIGHSRQTSVCCPFPSNPCTMPKVPGTGVAQLPRYAYNQVLRQCELFTYSGKAGNQNNFQSKSECEASCPVLDNPCATGMPSTLTDGSPQLCTVQSQTCPAGFWCHFGATSRTSLCCPGAGDPCRMALSRGSGNAVLNRWYYNTATKTCLSFSYSGRGGNQNNFVDLNSCRTRCPEYQNPCSTGQPHIGMTGQITHCGATTPSICPTTYWCHIGSSLDQSVCCPGAGNPCSLPQAQGNGQASLLRYYYDQATQTCPQFTYTGMGGNENNFMTLNACEQRCPVFRNPCAAGPPARGNTGQIAACSVRNLNSCPTNFWCHIGDSEQTTLCCPGAGTPCQQPVVVGTGEASLPRYYYSSLTQQCLPFTYSGIGGNQNNYLSRADCERSCPIFQNPCASGDPATGSNGQYTLCSASAPNVCPAGFWCHIGDPNVNSVCCPGAENACLLPLAAGSGGQASLSRWYFDQNLRRCTQFTYTGRLGNQNNFLSSQDCKLRCPEFANPCSTGAPAQVPNGGILFCSTQAQTCPATFWCHIGSNADNTVCCPGAGDPCIQPMLPGTGSAKLNRFYFNQNTRQCVPFTYTGQGGNQNSFLSENECAQRCPVFQNPCASTLAPEQVVFCSAQNRQVCPAGYWCHVGAVPQSSMCCPGQADPCQMPMATGRGTGIGPLRRWFFDVATRVCRQFDYTGLGGNQNNFLNREECQQKCPEFVNPCVSGEPYRAPASQLVRFCNMNSPTDCPSNYWCHVGANQQSTVCCPGMGDPCTVPLSIGNGVANMARWFFNSQSRRCQQFTYTGIGGNQNNFITQRACQLTCPEFSNPCGEGNPLTSMTGQVTYCSAQNVNICPLGYYCHVGISQESTVCCPGTSNPCNLPMSIGRGNAALQRYYFNQLTRKCENMVYSGTGGNANNFLTLQQCRQDCPEFDNPCLGQPYRSVGGQVLYCNSDSVCPPNNFCHFGPDTTTTMCCPSTGNACGQSVIVGSGRQQLTRYYYNSAMRQCTSFVYSGLGGNENNFRTQSECEARCRPAVNPCGGGLQPYQTSGQIVSCGTATGTFNAVCPNSYYCHVGADVYTTVCCPSQAPQTSPCSLPVRNGAGSAQVQRWYYDATSRRCQLFQYQGTGGNENNFQTQQSCVNVCVKRDLPMLDAQKQVARNEPSNMRQSMPINNNQSILLSLDAPCPQGEPLRDAQTGKEIACKFAMETLKAECPAANYICNVKTTGDAYCCPDPKQFCLLPRDPGHCGRPTASGGLQRRYGYNPATDTCTSFSYSGCAGNLNNFASLSACTNVCCDKGYNLLTQRYDSDQPMAADQVLDDTAERSRRSWLDWLDFF